jgi:hypothetical protein
MRNLLITYDTGYGATLTAAKIIRDIFANKYSVKVDLHAIDSANLSEYDSVIIGSPIRIGKCTPKIRYFLKSNSHVLAEKSVAFFFTCMSVTKSSNKTIVPIYIDPSFNISHKPFVKMSFMEKNHTSAFYLKQLQSLIDGVSPISVAFFKGNLELKKMSLQHWLIMKFAMFFLPEIEEGSFINPEIVREWSDSLFTSFRE